MVSATLAGTPVRLEVVRARRRRLAVLWDANRRMLTELQLQRLKLLAPSSDPSGENELIILPVSDYFLV